MANYYLMNKNKILLEFKTENILGNTEIKEVQSFHSLRPYGFIDIATWVEQRNYAKHKEHFQKWLKEWHLDTIDGFLSITHALGINDCLWVKQTDSSLLWEDVNLYDNEFSDVASKTAFETGLYGLQLSSSSPEFTAEGSFPKCWKKKGEDIILYKAGLTGASNVGLEPYSEYISSQISQTITDSIGESTNTIYDLVKFKGKICSICSLFTNQNIGFVPAYRLLTSNKRYTLNDLLQICSSMGYEQQFRTMILIDSITFNQDRHLGNFGFLMDNETFQILDFAPLFDFNISMLCNATMDDLNHFQTYEEEYKIGHKLGGTFLEVGKQIITPQIKPYLPKELLLPTHELYNLPLDRMNRLSDIFQKNYESIIGRGKNIYIPCKISDIETR